MILAIKKMQKMSFINNGTNVICPQCKIINKYKTVDDKTKILEYVNRIPVYAKKFVCTECGYEFPRHLPKPIKKLTCPKCGSEKIKIGKEEHASRSGFYYLFDKYTCLKCDYSGEGFLE